MTTEMARRIPFVSRHRQELERIKEDATHSRSYPVPDFSKEGFDEEDDNQKERLGLLDKVQNTVHDAQDSLCNYLSSRTRDDWIGTFLPCWRWLKSYRGRSKLLNDWIAGLTVGVMVIPQGMSYAKLAGLPVQYGLYSALMPVYAYALFGSSRQLAVGPVSIVSLLLSTGLGDLLAKEGLSTDASNYQSTYNRLAVQATFLVGVVTLALGIVRLGFLTIFLSHAVISGFTTGAAVIIAITQVKYILGYNIPRSDLLQDNLKWIFQNIRQFNYQVFLMGISAIAVLLGMKWLGKKYPRIKFVRALGPLTVTILGIITSAAANLKAKGWSLVGTIPSGFPSPTVNQWSPIPDLGRMFVVVIGIVIIGFMESISIGKQLAAKHKYEINSSDELIGLGMANFIGAMFSSYPVTGSFSRSAVNHDSGAESGLSGMVTATLVALVLLFLTPIFQILPNCILGAIVIAAVYSIMDFPEAWYLWKVHKFDFLVWMLAFVFTMFLGVEIGLGVSVGVSILLVIYEAAYPHTAVLGRLPGTTVYRNIKQYPEAERVDGILVVRVDAPLFFANASNVRDKIRKYRLATIDDMEQRHAGELKYIILEMTPVSHIDTSALHILEDMVTNHIARGQQLCFANPSLRVMDRLVKCGLADRVGRQHFFSCAHDAVNWCLAEMDNDAMSTHSIDVAKDDKDLSTSGGDSNDVNKEESA